MEWYWGESSKEKINDEMRDKPDGSFLVRKAANKAADEYTLTVRKGGSNKLIKIIHKGGKYGFVEHLMNFNSVQELVDHYRNTSLKEYNNSLDVTLTHPVSKQKSIKNKDNKNIDVLKNIYVDLYFKCAKHNKTY